MLTGVSTSSGAAFGSQTRAEQLKCALLAHIRAHDSGTPAPPMQHEMLLPIQMAIMSGMNMTKIPPMYHSVIRELCVLFSNSNNLRLLASAGDTVSASAMPSRAGVYNLAVDLLESLWRIQIQHGDLSPQTPQTPRSTSLIDFDRHFDGLGPLQQLLLKLLSLTIVLRELLNQLMIQFGDTTALEIGGASALAVRHLVTKLKTNRVSVEPAVFPEPVIPISTRPASLFNPIPATFSFPLSVFMHDLMNVLCACSPVD